MMGRPADVTDMCGDVSIAVSPVSGQMSNVDDRILTARTCAVLTGAGHAPYHSPNGREPTYTDRPRDARPEGFNGVIMG